MKKVGMMLPIEVEVADAEDYYTGEKVLSPTGDVKYQLQVVQEGNQLAQTGELVLRSVNSGRPGGGYSKSFEPSEFTFQINGYNVYPQWEDDPETGDPVPVGYGTAMPRSFYDAFKFRYSFSKSEEPEFQSYLHALDFKQFRVEGKPLNYNKELFNQRLYSFRSRLFMVCELNVGERRVVRLYQYDENDEVFKLFRSFDEVLVDYMGQDGSPDIFSAGNYLFVAYRSVDRDSNENRIIVWRTKDLGSWESRSFPMGRSYSVEYDTDSDMNQRGFRLRGASDGETVCIVVASRKSGGTSIVYKQMKSFLSFDFCDSLRENESGYASLSRVEQNAGYQTTQDYTGMLSMFAPQGFDDLTEDTGFSVNFALYYDEEMASFVIIKAGDPADMRDEDGDKASSYLVAAKTYDDDYSIWEPCLSMKLKDEVSLGGAGVGLAFNSFNAAKLEDYSLLDFDVVSLGGTNILSAVMEYKAAEAVSAQQMSQVCCFTEFTFLTKDRFSSIDYDKPLLAIGVKHHDEYLFAMSSLVPYSGGIMTQGQYLQSSEFNSRAVDTPAVAEHHHKVISLSREGGALAALSIGGQLMNIRETRPYQMNYCQHVCSVEDFMFNTSASGLHFYQEFSADGKKWNAMSNDTGQTYVELVPYYSGNISNLEFRLKFKYRLFDDQFVPIKDPAPFPNLMPIFQFGDLTIELEPQQYSIRVFDNGVHIGDIASGQPIFDNTLEIMMAVERPISISSNPDRRLSFYWRFLGGEWKTDFTPVSGSSIPAFAEPMQFGKLFTDSGIIFGLGDVQLGNDWAYEPVFTATRGEFEDYRTFSFNGFGFAPVENGGYISSFRNELYLDDGTILRVLGDGSPSVAGDVFRYVPSPRGNLLESVLDPFVNHVYDYSKYYNDNGEFVVELRNDDEEPYDSLSVFNLHGAYEVDIEFGRYVSNNFVSEETESFSVSKDVVTNSMVGEENLLGIEEKYNVHSLRGKTLVAYSIWSGVPEHFLIEDNNRSELKLDRDFPYHAESDVVLWIMEDSQTFLFDEKTWPVIRVKFEVAPVGNKKILGGILLGVYADLSRYITEMSEEVATSEDLVDSDFGRVYPTMVHDGVSYKEISFNAPLIEAKDHAYIFNLIHQVYKYHYGKPFVMHYTDFDGKEVSRMSVLSGTSSDSPSSYYRELDFSVMSQESSPFGERYFSGSLSADISYSPSSIAPNDQVDFLVEARDSLGGEITYLWDFGDGTSVETSVATVSHSYSTSGVKQVQCLIESSSGYKILRKTSVNVIEQST